MDWDKYFFSDVGKKIKAIIRWCFYVEVILILIAGVVLEIVALINLIMEGYGEIILMMLAVPVGAVLAIGTLWLSALLTYGFAEIVDTAIVNRHKENPTHTQPQPSPVPSTVATPQPPQKDPRAFSPEDYWVCALCESKNLKSRNTCWCCDAPRGAQKAAEKENDDWTCPCCEGDLEVDKAGGIWLCPTCKKQFFLKGKLFPRMIEI